MNRFLPRCVCITHLLFGCILLAAPRPDQYVSYKKNSLLERIASVSGITIDASDECLRLADGVLNGTVVFKPDTVTDGFNRGLPSWNGSAPDENSSFMVQLRFPLGAAWSTWLTVGFWKDYIWTSYGATSYSGGYIDYDYVKLNSYHTVWQFRVLMKRQSAQLDSPALHKLSFYVSDSESEAAIDYTAIMNDKPAELFIPTDFIYQYDVDDNIGGSICSPTSTAMVLRSYDIEVDPLQFALDTQDPHWGIFGI